LSDETFSWLSYVPAGVWFALNPFSQFALGLNLLYCSFCYLFLLHCAVQVQRSASVVAVAELQSLSCFHFHIHLSHGWRADGPVSCGFGVFSVISMLLTASSCGPLALWLQGRCRRGHVLGGCGIAMILCHSPFTMRSEL